MEIDAFGKRVRYLRTLAKLTQAQMAEKLGVTPEHLGNIERGVSVPSFELIYRIADALNTEPFNLFLSVKKRSDSCSSSWDNSWSSFLSGMGNWEYDLASGSMYWSDSLYRLLGLSPKETQPSIEFMLERVHPNDLDRIREKWSQLLNGNNVAPTKFRVWVGDGEYRTVINFGEVRKGQGVIVGFNVDITENCMLVDAFRELHDVVEEEAAGRTRSLNDMIVTLASAMEKKDSVQAELEDRETLYRSFVENIRDIFHVMVPGRGFTYVSSVCEDILGIPASDIIEDIESFYAIVHPQDRERVRDIHNRRLQGDKADGLYRIIRNDGEVRQLRSRSFIMPETESDDSPKIIGITEDVTDVRDAESARKRAENFLKHVLTAVGDAVCIVDKEHRIVCANEGMAQLFGPIERHAGRIFEELLEQTQNENDLVPLAESSGELTIIRRRNPDGELRTLEMHEFPWFRDDGELDGAVVVLRDVTEKMQVMQNLGRTCEEKDRFLAYLSHEIRTPLNGMLGLLQLLKMEYGSLGGEYLDAAMASGDMLTDLINGVLDLSHLQSGRMQINEEVFDPQELVCSILVQFRHLATMKSLNLTGRYEDGLPSALVGDKKRIRQILSNLVGNAIKFTDEGVVSIEAGLISVDQAVEMEVATNPGGKAAGVLRLVVRDTGEGISEDKIGCIFDEYMQAGGSRKASQGYGLGLAIIKRLLQALGGDIKVQSKPAEGSAFSCYIPVKRAR